jgi:tetratricopeptide (TPR) repeat protein
MRVPLAAVALAACSSALHEPSPIETYAPHQGGGRTAADLLRDADAAWAARDKPDHAGAAQGLYLDAAVADPHAITGVLGAMQAIAFRVEYERGVDKGRFAEEEVELGQWCQRRAPNEPACDYRLALALGQLAREHSSQGHDALNRMMRLLHQAIAAAPKLDDAGPHRVLALVLLRAPGWPTGPGDPDAALDEAKAAIQLFPESAQNLNVLGEALAATGDPDGARAAYEKATAAATAARAAGNPDAEHWLADARSGAAKVR